MDTDSRPNGEPPHVPRDGGGAPPVFDWSIYGDATFAGLAVLIPIPLLDLFFEWVFARRVPAAIAVRRKRPLAPSTIRDLNQGRWRLTGCLLFPFRLALIFVKRLYRTVLYFLTIKDASDKLSHHWHRAFLIDHSIRQGQLDHPQHAGIAVQAIAAVLDDVTTSPATRLANQVVGGAKHALRTVLRRYRRGQEDEVAREAHARIGQGWAALGAHFAGVALQYDRAFAQFSDARSVRLPG